MPTYDRPTKVLMKEFAATLGRNDTFTRQSAINWFSRHYPRTAARMVGLNVDVLSTNDFNTRQHHPYTRPGSGHDLFYKLGPSTFRLWDPKRDPAPVYAVAKRRQSHVQPYPGSAHQNPGRPTQMLSALKAPKELRKAVALLQSKFKADLIESAGIWAEININGYCFYGVAGNGRRAVEINVPVSGRRTMGLIAKEKDGLFLCHNGQLNKRLQITQEELFDAMANIRDVRLSTNKVAKYIVISRLNDSPKEVVRDVARFVRVCQELADAHIRTLPANRLEELARRTGKKTPAGRRVTVTAYARSLHVAAWAKHLAKGRCDLCGKRAPFTTNDGPYLECHHIIHLAEKGSDTSDNTVALCPNCHRRMHVLNDDNDKQKLKRCAACR